MTASRPALHAALHTKLPIVAQDCVEAQFAVDPTLRERWGEAGYRKSLEDAGHTLRFLAEAVMSGEPGIFTRYVTWLAKVLGAAGVPLPVLAAHFEHLEAALARHLTDEQVLVLRTEFLDPARRALTPSVEAP